MSSNGTDETMTASIACSSSSGVEGCLMEITAEDSSAWIRPGLGYRYAVQAYDRAGNMSPRREHVVQTPDNRPDLIVSDVQVPECKAGDKVRFRASVRNVGRARFPMRPRSVSRSLWIGSTRRSRPRRRSFSPARAWSSKRAVR